MKDFSTITQTVLATDAELLRSKINGGNGITIPAQGIGAPLFQVPLIYDGRRAHLILTYTESESGFSFGFDSVEMGGEFRSLVLDWPLASVPSVSLNSHGELDQIALPPEVVQVIERELNALDQTQFGGREHRESLA